MNTITYFLETNIALSIVAGFYYWMLRNETNFQFQRWFILGGIICSLIFPFIQIESNASIPSMSGLVGNTLPELTVTENQTVFEFKNILVLAYIIISSAIFLRMIWSLFKLVRLWWVNKRNNEEGRSTLGSFSFLNLIFIEHSYSSQDKEMILKHEQVHTKLFHSADIILIELLKVVFWFNPFVYLLRKEITSIHEFQADELALKSVDAEQYCNLLARVALQSADFPIANHFNNSLTIKRIAMITNAKLKLSRWKIVSSAAVLGLLFAFISCSEQPGSNASNEKVTGQDLRSGKVYTEVQETAMPADGLKIFYEGIANTLVYPSEAREKGIQGKVFIQFIVNIDGTISDATVLRGIGSGCDEAALKAVATSTVKWNPGMQDGKAVRQQMVVPINFQLEGDQSKNTSSLTADPSQKKLDELVAVGKKK